MTVASFNAKMRRTLKRAFCSLYVTDTLSGLKCVESFGIWDDRKNQ